MSKPWNVPTWFAPEDLERYERMVESLHDVVRGVRAVAERVNPARESDISAWEARVTAITHEADDWTRRLERVFGKTSPLRATNETPTVGSTEGT